jgi:hypothetical protein
MSTSAPPIVRVGPAGDQDNRDVADDTPDTATVGTRGGHVVRTLALPLVGLTLGALPGAAYAALVAIVHLAVRGRWDRVPAFAAACVVVGAAVGLAIALGAVLWPRAPQPASVQPVTTTSQTLNRQGGSLIRLSSTCRDPEAVPTPPNRLPLTLDLAKRQGLSTTSDGAPVMKHLR